MPLQQGVVESYDFDRMIVHFTMLDSDQIILCAITTAAMDDLEGSRNVGSHQRMDQFMRLRAKIEARASIKFVEQGEIKKEVMLRSNDFFK
ncbi:MAG TPA: DUF1488 family protein [Xanthobacteraceae bacterium]|jgi:hypothetical protein|nr:DUF1488 family protein [Xanthobacteraceae bacterium]